VGRARNVVLATAETDERGRTNVPGGADVLERLGAHVGASNLPEGIGGVLQRFEHTHEGLPTLATVVAGVLGREPAPAAFEDGGAWIDFHGPPGTIDTVSFSDLVSGRVEPVRVRGRIVVVGAASPTLQDVHPTPTGDALMSGPEIEANAIDTAIRGLPLRGVPGWTDLLLVLGLGFLPALISIRWRALVAVVLSPVIAAAFFFAAQFAFEHGRILPVSAPLFALTLGTLTTISAGYAAERRWRQRVTRRNKQLEDAVPYKDPWPLEEALAELRRERGRHFDPAVLDAFLGIVDDLDSALLAPSEPAARLGRPGPGRRPESRAGTPRSGR
jgi:CHASE2 domain-containing sensor protein